MDEIGRAYVSLGLGVDQHVEGFVDAYIGIQELKASILARGTRPVPELRTDAERLSIQIDAAQLPEPRKTYLQKQVQAISTVLAKLDGEIVPFREEVQWCFDISPEPVPEEEFEAAVDEIDRLLSGSGSLVERVETWKRQSEVPEEKVLPLLRTCLDEARGRTASIVELPQGEDVEIQLVRDQPWGGYNWYLGGYKSRVEVNVDLPMRVSQMLPLITHEGYPGHHTEHAIKEKLLLGGRGWEEASIFLLNTPECVIAEGIGNVALDMIFEEEELYRWSYDHLYREAGLENLDVERDRALARAFRRLAGVGGNVAFLAHERGASDDELVAYLQRYALRTENEARLNLRFIRNPLFRAYVFTYFYGEGMLRQALAGPDRMGVFRRLLSEQVYPSLVEEWIAGGQQDSQE